MKLTFLGVGGAFTMTNFHSNILLENDGKRFLIDCGSDIRYSLANVGLNANDIDAVYISHCHADHAGGLEYLCFNRYFSSKIKPNLYVHEKIVDTLWNNTLKGGMSSHQGVLLNLNSFFNYVYTLQQNTDFTWRDIFFNPIQTVHYMNGYEIVPSYGLFIKTASHKIFITTDTQFCPNQIMSFYKMSDIIFQDCETYDWKEKFYKQSGVHAHYNELKTLSPEIKKKMWLYHYNDGELPEAENDGFAGFVKKGQVFNFFPV